MLPCGSLPGLRGQWPVPPGHSWVPLAVPELLREMFCFQFLCWGCAGNEAPQARRCGEGTGAAGHGQSSHSSGASALQGADAAQPCSTRAQTRTLSSLSLCPGFQGRVSLHCVPSAAAAAHPSQIPPAPHPAPSPGHCTGTHRTFGVPDSHPKELALMVVFSPPQNQDPRVTPARCPVRAGSSPPLPAPKARAV